MRFVFLTLAILFCLIGIAQKGSKQKIYSSFTTINDGLEKTRADLTKQINQQYYFLIKKDSTLVLSLDSLREKTNTLIRYINQTKVLLIVKTEELKKVQVIDNDTIISLKHLTHFDDYYTPTEFLIGTDRWNPEKGRYTTYELQKQIKEYIDYIKKEYKQKHIVYLQYNDYSFVNRFYQKPLAGVITYLSKIQLDIKLQEQNILIKLAQNEKP